MVHLQFWCACEASCKYSLSCKDFGLISFLRGVRRWRGRRGSPNVPERFMVAATCLSQNPHTRTHSNKHTERWWEMCMCVLCLYIFGCFYICIWSPIVIEMWALDLSVYTVCKVQSLWNEYSIDIISYLHISTTIAINHSYIVKLEWWISR